MNTNIFVLAKTIRDNVVADSSVRLKLNILQEQHKVHDGLFMLDINTDGFADAEVFDAYNIAAIYCSDIIWNAATIFMANKEYDSNFLMMYQAQRNGKMSSYFDIFGIVLSDVDADLVYDIIMLMENYVE